MGFCEDQLNQLPLWDDTPTNQYPPSILGEKNPKNKLMKNKNKQKNVIPEGEE